MPEASKKQAAVFTAFQSNVSGFSKTFSDNDNNINNNNSNNDKNKKNGNIKSNNVKKNVNSNSKSNSNICAGGNVDISNVQNPLITVDTGTFIPGGSPYPSPSMFSYSALSRAGSGDLNMSTSTSDFTSIFSSRDSPFMRRHPISRNNSSSVKKFNGNAVEENKNKSVQLDGTIDKNDAKSECSNSNSSNSISKSKVAASEDTTQTQHVEPKEFGRKRTASSRGGYDLY